MSASKVSKSPSTHSDAPRIFVVDDEPMLLELATVVLEPFGYPLKTFRDPKAALRAFSSAKPRPQLLITDYAMHFMNGMELIVACRRLQPALKILLISGTVDSRIYRDSTVKPDLFLPKPYQAKQLVEAVLSLLSATAPDQPKRKPKVRNSK